MALTAIVILNYNNYEDTINCIESVELYNSAPVKYIVVDNGSPREGTVERLHNFLSERFAQSYTRVKDSASVLIAPLPRITLLVSKTNDGYARGNNKGLRLARADAEVGQILVLNNDILFIEDIIPELLHNLETLPQAGIVSPMLLKKGGKNIDYNCARTNATNWEIILDYLLMGQNIFGLISRARYSHQLIRMFPSLMQKSHVEIELPSGSCMLFKKDLLETIRLFDSGTFLYYEENIIFKQTERSSFKNYLIPSLKCIHLGAATMKKTESSFVQWAGTKSALYYLREYGNMTMPQKMALPMAYILMKIKCTLLRIFKA